MKYDGAKITVLNWGKYNPRKDVKRPSWFALSNSVATAPGLFGLNCEYKWLWVFVLCEASKKNGEPFLWNSAYVEAFTGLSSKSQDAAIEIFINKEMLSVNVTSTLRKRDTGVTHSHATDRQTLQTNITDTHMSSGDDLPVSKIPKLAEIWNQNRGPLPGVKACGKDRAKKAALRWKEKPDPEYWESVVVKLAASPFCRGEGSTGWRASFDFLLQPETQHKVLEGKYDGFGSKTQRKSISEILEEK